ncbi:zinc-binding dehydrogenase [Rhodococcus sp. OK302]|uniref:zinc-binding dehydrogenase n=1 Tax=Rhodococcus sp. OK302 TaxID=1882769 RepID=UPI000B943D5A|nr:zinc-binding dehydrogenase [Rhodococcus sp. OK302]OYD70340.1 putative phosphonate catabolism associated alcohol dehydrogenase [Rhodococcus sp. OK302]
MDQVTPRLTRAAVWTRDGIDIRELEIPELGPGDVLVRVSLATVCGSDLHTVSGRRDAPCPSILGHEAVGRVIAIGRGARPQVVGEWGHPLAVGDRIVWSVTVPCNRCARCVNGFTAKCVNVRKVGHEPAQGPWTLSGSYAAHIVLPRGTAIALVPDSLPDAVAAPAACATATVMAALEAAGDLTDKRVLIFGAGMLGVTAAAAAVEAGADVRVVEPNPSRQRQSHRFGASDDDGATTDIAIDFSGVWTAVDAALQRLDVGGRLVLAGSVSPGPAIAVDPEDVVRRWLTITGVHNYEPRHLSRAVALLATTCEKYPWASLVAEPVPLDDVARVLRPTSSPAILRASVAP